MSRAFMLIILGVLIMLAPFSGLPMSLLSWILPVLGLLVLALGVSYKRVYPRSRHHEAPLSAPR